MAFVFDHVTRLGLGAMSPTGPVWEQAQPKGFLSGGTEGGGGGGTASQLATLTSHGNSGGALPSKVNQNESVEVLNALREVFTYRMSVVRFEA